MPRKKTSAVDDILALPHTRLIDGQPYVRIVFKTPDGRQREKTCRVNSVSEAISAIERIRQELGDRGPGAFDGERMTFAELMKEYKKARKIPKWYEEPMIERFGQMRIRSITYGDIEQFKEARAKVPNRATGEQRSSATINRELEWLRTILLYAVRHEWLIKNPFNKGPAPLIRKSEEEARERIPTPEEEARILEYCMNFKSWVEKKRESKGFAREQLAELTGDDALRRLEAGEDVKNAEITKIAEAMGESPKKALAIARGRREHLHAILIAARDTGLRKAALLSLAWSNVDFSVDGEDMVVGNFLRVPKGNRYKKRPKVIALTARLKCELQGLWERSTKNSEAKIFGGILDVKRSYNKACSLAGVEDLHFHDWRHGFATDMMEAGVEERVAMRATGHTNAETHAIYTNVDERIALHIAERLNALHSSREQGSKTDETVTASEYIN
jgi:integrase